MDLYRESPQFTNISLSGKYCSAYRRYAEQYIPDRELFLDVVKIFKGVGDDQFGNDSLD